jgi:hypothetical protein
MNHIAWTKRKAAIALALCVIIAVSSVMFLQNNQTTQAAIINPHPGLVGWWPLDEGIGTVAGDISGNGNTGTIYGATSVSGKFGSALSFNGVNNFVNVPDSDTLNFGTTTNFTITCWLNVAQSGVYQYFLAKDYGSPGSWELFIDSTNVLRFGSSDGGASLVGTTNVADANWHFVSVVCTRNGQAQLYVDGKTDGFPRNMVGGSVSSNAPLRMGSNGGGNGWFKGLIDEVRIYSRALTPAEIQTEFQNPSFSSYLLAKVPLGTTQVIVTLSWQGVGSINTTIVSPVQNYTEAALPVYQKTTYSTTDGAPTMLNIKRLSVAISALPSDQNWFIALTLDSVNTYQISVEVQK